MDLVHRGLYDAKMKAAYPKALIQPPSQEICTCYMLTVTLLLLYRKGIPLRFLPWCDNLGILVFLCFSKIKIKKIDELYVHFEFQVGSPGPNWLKFGEHVVSTFADKTMSANFDYFCHLKIMPFLQAVMFFPRLQTLSSCKKITNVCAKILRHCF